MEPNLIQVINALGKEKNIPKETIVEAIQAAILTASRKKYGTEENIEVEINMQTGEIEAYLYREVVENVEDASRQILLKEALEYDETIELGDEFAIRLDVAELGRIAAQTAKQVIVQRVREAERAIILKEFGGRIGETINGIVMRMERGDLIVDLGKAEGVLPQRQKIPGERYNRGERVRALIKNVVDSSKMPQVILSRTDPLFVAKLFETEVPEIYEGVVKIIKVVREPGQRSKLAVVSRDSNVDPVGACVGIKGIRVQAVVQELRGEKIDIISHTDVVRDYIEKALSPAAISRIAVNEEEKSAWVVVEESQLSLAIGKKGQNVRLGSELTGYQINIMSEEEYQRTLKEQQEEAETEKESYSKSLEEISKIRGVGEKTASAILNAGYRSIADLASATSDALSAIPGVGVKTAEKILQSAAELLKEAAEKQAEADALQESAESEENHETGNPDGSEMHQESDPA
ncbi:MAG: transcription termination/antitermination protein NusA [Nitrospirae bacterium CG_4_9_14_3_um_filter_53_35]|nr:MAG: transcription termination factor NusA [Nitrospirae bacterium CG2_30_53_67]PIS38053.1 MAG: transcription termination/antitermination protein NusA [Nitrospirae bacterium CG08_land_8_20_14_0_20_52_24]PIV83157.1 MAG: transcription termination/antitermination protein NusA [Nitrospirae bacterium CG17_big_fil_post_rev_8_21_14_2_50_50_9]PIW85266.1 MAG: transcription termination/antitermination protein NusA [Nitrospirae bacterium CG_4_8_14_3_um_filter_50_41]PIX86541.1 MAG: transcription terminat